MDIPSLPTDNFYKFLSISGIAIVIFSYSYFLKIKIELDNDYSKMEIESIQISKELKFHEEDSKKIEIDINSLRKTSKELEQTFGETDNSDSDANIIKYYSENYERMIKDKNFRDFIELRFKYEDKMNPNLSKIKNIKNQLNKREKIRREMEVKDAILEKKLASSREKLSNLKNFSIVTGIMILIGTLMSFFGFRNWYLLVQKPLDLKLKLDLEELKEIKKIRK